MLRQDGVILYNAINTQLSIPTPDFCYWLLIDVLINAFDK